MWFWWLRNHCEKHGSIPFFWKIYLDYQDAMKVYENGRNRFEYNGSDYGMDLYARTHIDTVWYKDGTVVKFDLFLGGIGGGSELEDKEKGIVVIRNSFGQVIDVDQLQAVHFGNVNQWLDVGWVGRERYRRCKKI